jgi:TfoX/Sxy family transcriptional regulator of competence genes
MPIFKSMAYNEELAHRIRENLKGNSDIIEKKMFGGLAFLYKGKMSVGIVRDDLMARVVEGKYEEELSRPHVREMDFTRRPMKGFIFVEPEGYSSDADLNHYIVLGLEHAEQAAQ